MRKNHHYKLWPFVLIVAILSSSGFSAQNRQAAPTDEEKWLTVFHAIESQTLLDYVKELCSEKYGGRLTGTKEYIDCADWVISLLKNWGIQPGGEKGTYLQSFPNPYTLVFRGGEVTLNLPVKDGVVKKYYKFEDEYIPGATSASGEITADVVYVGYGITAPELGYDEYKGLDVKDKIVMMEPESPVGPDKPEEFKKWRPYSFHQYKLENAYNHGARGLLYNYGPIANPNNSYREGFIYCHVGDVVVADVFAGTGRVHKEVLETMRRALKPQSFTTGKRATIKMVTEHHAEGVGINVIGLIPGSDPVLKSEVIIVGGHLDHMGRCPELMPGATDNAAAVAVTLGLAEAMSKTPFKPKRSIMFFFFGAEEQGVAGSDYYCEHPIFPLEKTAGFINLEGTGSGDKLGAGSALNYPKFWEFLDRANQKYIHRITRPSANANLARPRQDSARFMWKGVPSITLGSYGFEVPYPTYHNTRDNLDLITPEIMRSTAQLLFAALTDMADEPALGFRQ